MENIDDKKLFSLSKRRIRSPKEELLADIHAYFKECNNRPITAVGYNKWSNRRFSRDTIVRSFDSWENACIAAGIKNKYVIYDDETLIKHFEKVWRWRNQKLVQQDLLDYNRRYGTTINPDLYARRWGVFPHFVGLFSQYKLGQISFDQLLSMKIKKKIREAISPRLRAIILKRDNYTCRDCGCNRQNTPGVKLHVHHIIPVSNGGKTEQDNLITNCDKCNLGKSDKIASP